jgi:predicted NACHT family NTPase
MIVMQTKESNNSVLEKIAFFSECETQLIYASQHLVKQLAWVIEHDSLEEAHHTSPVEVLEGLLRWVEDKQTPYCALLGEYGMGKTMTCMLFTQYLLKEYKNSGEASVPLPLYLNLRHIGDYHVVPHLNIIDILALILKNGCVDHLELALTAESIIQSLRENKLLIIFDGLDEVLVHLLPSEGEVFTSKLLNILSYEQKDSNTNGHLLLTCRTNYFRNNDERNLHFMRKDHQKPSLQQYQIFILKPFSEAQIEEFFQQNVPGISTEKLVEVICSVHNLKELAERPYTLNLIPELIPYIEEWILKGVNVMGVTIYRHMVLSWLERDTERHTLMPDHKLNFMEYFAAQLWRSGKTSWNIDSVEHEFALFMDAQQDIKLHYFDSQHDIRIEPVFEVLKEDLRVATFLIRIGNDHFRFAHTSLFEFFLASYLYRALVENRMDDWNMPSVSQETLVFLGQLISENEFESILQTLSAIRDQYHPKISELVFSYMLMAHHSGYPSPSCEGICLDGADLNEWQILGKANTDKEPKALLNLRHASFRGARLRGANLRYLNLQGADFTGADLSGSEITRGDAQRSCFKGANLNNAGLIQMQFQGADFSDATLHLAEWLYCNLVETIGLEDKYSSKLFALCEPKEKFNQDIPEEELLKGHQSVIMACYFSSTGSQLASASWDKTLRVWDTASGNMLYLLNNKCWVHDCSFAPNHHRLVAALVNETLCVWDLTTRHPLFVLAGHAGEVRCCAYSLDGQYIASGSNDATVKLWDAQTGECLKTLTHHQLTVRGCTFSSLNQLATASDDMTIHLWSSAQSTSLTLKGHTDWVRKCSFSSDGKWLVSASGDKTLRLWDCETGQCIRVFKGHNDRVRDCHFSPDATQIISASDDATLRLWDVESGRCIKKLEGHTAKIRGCAFSTDGLIASASDDLTIRLWEAQTGRCTHVLGSARAPS